MPGGTSWNHNFYNIVVDIFLNFSMATDFPQFLIQMLMISKGVKTEFCKFVHLKFCNPTRRCWEPLLVSWSRAIWLAPVWTHSPCCPSSVNYRECILKLISTLFVVTGNSCDWTQKDYFIPCSFHTSTRHFIKLTTHLKCISISLYYYLRTKIWVRIQSQE